MQFRCCWHILWLADPIINNASDRPGLGSGYNMDEIAAAYVIIRVVNGGVDNRIFSVVFAD